jgi:hypothetical protein
LAPAIDRLLQADHRGALLLEGLALVLEGDAERDQLSVEPRDLVLPLLEEETIRATREGGSEWEPIKILPFG